MAISQPVEDPAFENPATPEMHISPEEAAKEIREIAKRLMNGGPPQDHRTAELLHGIALLGSQLAFVENRQERVIHYLKRVRASTTNKRTHAQLDMVAQYHDSSMTYTKKVRDQQNSLYNFVSNSKVEAPAGDVDRLHVLAQALPTFKGAMLTPAENVLHAISVILKNNGYLKKVMSNA